MPRTDIHNADDLATVIRREVSQRNIVKTGMAPREMMADRIIEPIMTTTLAAIRGTIGQDRQTDFDLLKARTFNQRIAAPIQRVGQTARFRR